MKTALKEFAPKFIKLVNKDNHNEKKIIDFVVKFMEENAPQIGYFVFDSSTGVKDKNDMLAMMLMENMVLIYICKDKEENKYTKEFDQQMYSRMATLCSFFQEIYLTK